MTGTDTVARDAALWRYELEGKRRDSAARREIRILERDGRPVGYIVHAVALFGANLTVMGFEVIATDYEFPARVYAREAHDTQLHPAWLNTVLVGRKSGPTPDEYVYEL